ncbi:hypothetical protein ACF1HJ_19700 [Streptomyces sp. NPDC013978]|uniref:hypothetical protein n=1 Tax=Streptomyces sp. NPDC013978 TaxID=3364869 RepID=UPI0036FCCE47
MNASTEASEISPTERIRTLAEILSGRITAQEGARRHDLPVRVVRQWLREIPVAERRGTAAPADQVGPASGEESASARVGRRPLPRCRVVVDEMVQGLGL